MRGDCNGSIGRGGGSELKEWYGLWRGYEVAVCVCEDGTARRRKVSPGQSAPAAHCARDYRVTDCY